MDDDWTEVTIRGVVIDPMSGEPTVLLEDREESAIIAVSVDPSNAVTIISELEGLSRELTNTVLYRFFVRHGVTVHRVGLSNNRTSSMSASIHYSFGSDQFTMETSPTEALMIAIQTEAPIVAHGSLIQTGEAHPAPRIENGSDLLILSRRSSTRQQSPL